MPYQQTAYFHARPVHAAYFAKCETCLAHPQEPCLSTFGMIGTGVAEGMPIKGMHAARVQAGLELEANGMLAKPTSAA